jgi:hypothetical protein
MGGDQQSMQKGEADRAFKKGRHGWISVNRIFSRQPVLKRRSRQTLLFRKQSL